MAPKKCAGCDGTGRSKSESGPCLSCYTATGEPRPPSDLVECPSCDGQGVSREGSGICMRCKGLQMVDPKYIVPSPLAHLTNEQLRARELDNVAPVRSMQAMPRHIARAVFCAQLGIAAAPKSSTNEGDGYAYASAETILVIARAALLEEGVVIQVVDVQPAEDDRLAVAMQLEHIESGEVWQRTRRVAVVVDYKGRDKAESAAETLALSYFLRGVLAIPRVDVDVDARSDRRPVANDDARSAPSSSKRQAPTSANPNAAVTVLLNTVSNCKTLEELDAASKAVERAVKKREVSQRDAKTLRDTVAEVRPRCEAADAHAAAERGEAA